MNPSGPAKSPNAAGTPANSRPATGMTFGRPTTAGSLGSGPSPSETSTFSGPGPTSFAGFPPSVASNNPDEQQPSMGRRDSTMSTASANERDVSGIVMPESSGNDEETRRRTSLSQELDERGIAQTFDPTPHGGGGADHVSGFDISSVDASQMKPFLMTPAPKSAGMIECRIIRECSGFNKFFPKYVLESDHGHFLMSAKKQKKNKTSNYLISMSRSDMTKQHDAFLGKLRSNFLGLEFTAYGAGMNP